MNETMPHQEILLLVDIQNDYLPGGAYEVPGSTEAAAAAAFALAQFRHRREPVVHIRHIATKPGSTFFLPDSFGSEIHAHVRPTPDEPVVIKHFPNAFRETNLLEVLRHLEAKRLLIVGMMTHMCIDATTRAACDLGFDCTVVSDACAAPGQDFEGTVVPPEHVHASFLAALSGSYAKIIRAADLA